MKKHIKDYFSESDSPRERWNILLSLLQGFRNNVIGNLQRMKAFHDLLDLEIDQNSVAKTYLQECKKTMESSEKVLHNFGEIFQVQRLSRESIDMKIFLEAIKKRIGSTQQWDIDIEYESEAKKDAYLIDGNLVLLQQAYLDIFYFMREISQTENFHVSCALKSYDKHFFSVAKSSLSPGKFIAVTITASEPSSCSWTSSLAHHQFLNHNNKREITFICGVALQHSGDVFFPQGKHNINACMLLFPTNSSQETVGYVSTHSHDVEMRGNETVLLVDDEDMIWDVGIDMLQRMGYTVILATNGQECVEVYKNNPGEIHIVLLDMIMPELNGREAFFQLKEHDPNVKVLLSSGYVQEEDAQDVLQAGAAGFIQKPYRMKDLAKKIRQIFDS